MLTQDAVRKKLDIIADDVSKMPGLHYELYAQLYSAKVHDWMRRLPHDDVALVERIAENDPDYVGAVGEEIDIGETHAPLIARRSTPIFNPDWDVSY